MLRYKTCSRWHQNFSNNVHQISRAWDLENRMESWLLKKIVQVIVIHPSGGCILNGRRQQERKVQQDGMRRTQAAATLSTTTEAAILQDTRGEGKRDVTAVKYRVNTIARFKRLRGRPARARTRGSGNRGGRSVRRTRTKSDN